MSTSRTCSGKKVFMIERRKVVTHDHCLSSPIARSRPFLGTTTYSHDEGVLSLEEVQSALPYFEE